MWKATDLLDLGPVLGHLILFRHDDLFILHVAGSDKNMQRRVAREIKTIQNTNKEYNGCCVWRWGGL